MCSRRIMDEMDGVDEDEMDEMDEMDRWTTMAGILSFSKRFLRAAAEGTSTPSRTKPKSVRADPGGRAPHAFLV